MKKNNCLTRLKSILLAVLLIFALPLSVSAQEVDPTDEIIVSGISVPDNSEVHPEGFTRQYTRYLTSSSAIIMSDSNWFGEDTVLVQFKSSEGPTQISVYVIDGAGNTIGPRTIDLSKTSGFLLRSVSGSFEVYARKSAGYDGNVTVSVTLTNTY